jgi:hypothetical protein
VRSNPSIERTCPGKPGHASHLKRWASRQIRSSQASFSVESNALALLCFFLFGSVRQMPGAFALLLSWFRGSYAGSFFTLSTLGFPCSMCSACSTRCFAYCQFIVGASRHSAAPGSQFIGSQLLAGSSSEFTHRTLPAKVEAFSRSGFVEWFVCRAQTEVAVAESSFLSPSSTVPCSRAMPNPSINRTANGGSRLLSFASAQPPLSAGYLKRWAALTKHRAMRSSVEPSVAGQVLLAWPSTNASVPSCTASKAFVARPRRAQARCRWSAAAGTVPTNVDSRGFASPACRAHARSMHRCYPVSWLAAVGARRVLRHAKVRSPCTRTAAKVARLAAPYCIGSIQQVPPNPSINRTCPGKPGHAVYLKR